MNISAGNILVIIASILASIVLHEAMHAYAAHALGDTTAQEEGRLTLNPLKHIDMLMTVALPITMVLFGLPPIMIAKPVPFDPSRVKFGEYGAAMVALAGPFTNLALAVIASVGIRFIGSDNVATSALLSFMEINIVLFVFNMIPFPPLDGSRLLYAFAPEPVQRIMYQIESAGFLVTIMLFLVLSSFILPFVSGISNSIAVFLLR